MLGKSTPISRHRWRDHANLPWVIGVLALVVLVALSRLYLGVHYLSDVVAAFAEASAWLSLCLLGVQRYLKL